MYKNCKFPKEFFRIIEKSLKTISQYMRAILSFIYDFIFFTYRELLPA